MHVNKQVGIVFKSYLENSEFMAALNKQSFFKIKESIVKH